MYDDILLMSLKELRDSIKLDKKRWKHIFTTNCYAFSLGLDVKEGRIKPCAYIPGNIGNSKEKFQFKKIFSYDLLLNNLYDDLIYMGIEFREVSPSYEVESNEWKIALLTSFLTYEYYVEYLKDFHFLRQMDDKLWYHKMGWCQRPTNRDFKHNLITDPRTADFNGYFRQLEYKKTLCLRIK